MRKLIQVAFLGILLTHCEHEKTNPELVLEAIYMGAQTINLKEPFSTGLPIDQPIVLSFSTSINVNSVTAISLTIGGQSVNVEYSFFDNNKSVSLSPITFLETNTTYTVHISSGLKGRDNQNFTERQINFKTLIGTISITSLKFDGVEKLDETRILNVNRSLNLEITFSKPIAAGNLASAIQIVNPSGSLPLQYFLSENDKKITITHTDPLIHLSRYQLIVSNILKGANDETFIQFSKYFYTAVDPTPKFPVISDNELLTLVQQQTFKYFYDFAHPVSGMARERNSSGNTVTSGGSGFGIMALIVGMERGFITRADGLTRMDKILDFLETADRFHGAWPHWMNGNTGDVIPFSANDNGGDLVETSFLIQGLLTFRQYLNTGVAEENSLINRINVLWQGVEWDWYRRCDPTCQNVLYWHWSPDKNWVMNFPLYGYFEEQITYVLAAASPTHPILKNVYSNGYGKNGAIVKNNVYEGITLPLESPTPLFWVQYSYLGLDPHFTDDYTNYWTQNVNASLINQKYCIRNPKNFVGYSDACWGLTASDNQSGYSAHSPANDLGVIAPTAALSSFPYTPTESMKALKFFYYTMGDRLWGTYGFYDAFNPTENWYASSYLAIDQGPIIVMIENYRTGLLWNLFMSAPEVQTAKNELDFN